MLDITWFFYLFIMCAESNFSISQNISFQAQFAVRLGLKGAMVWSIGTDNFHGGCQSVQFPLLWAIRDGLNVGHIPTPPPHPSTVVQSGVPTDDTTICTAYNSIQISWALGGRTRFYSGRFQGSETDTNSGPDL